MKILAPIDSSNNAHRVVDYLIREANDSRGNEVVVLNVRAPVEASEAGQFLSEARIREFQEREGALLVEAARKTLEAAGIHTTGAVKIGDIATTIAKQCKALSCDQIVMGSRGMSPIANLLMGSVATKVLHLVEVPVTLVK